MADKDRYTIQDFKREQLPKVGERIRKARQRSGLTQQDLAKLIGTTDKSISALETGRVEPSISQMQAIATSLGKPIATFTGEDLGLLESKLQALMDEFEDIKSAFYKKDEK